MDVAAPLRVERLTPARREDFLRFFDHERGPAFADNPGWAPCYCHFHHVAPALDWSALTAEANRMAMDARIACAEMEGYLAYRDEQVVGWLNAQPRHRLQHCEARIGVAAPATGVPAHRAAAIVCFVVAPMERGHGVARGLLVHALDDLAARGVVVVDAYPARQAAADAADGDHFRGPPGLFAATGFAPVGGNADTEIVRKWLHGP